MKALSKQIFKLSGWKIVGDIPPGVNKAVMIIAPHTSLWDFIIGRLAFNILGLNAKFLIKKEFFKFPIGYFLKRWGGIPIERGSKSMALKQIQRVIKNEDSIILIITPEGTRKPVKRWKKGFYKTALNNNLPIIMGALDYSKKQAIISSPLEVSGNLEKDMVKIRNFYKDIQGKHPQNFNREVH